MTLLTDLLEWIKEESIGKNIQVQFNISPYESFEVGAVYMDDDNMTLHIDLDPIESN